jgi:RHS repeat-associated protein
MPSPASRMSSRVDANVVRGFLSSLALLATLVVPFAQQRAYAVPAGGSPVPVPPVALSVPASPIVPASSVGYLADDWSATPGGAFTDSVGLHVPAGRAGMQPHLSLRYSSSGGNGLLGMGWTVAGATSQISRCGRTIAAEGTLSGITYDQTDRYCLDGQKLVAVGAVDYGSGEYGGIDTQYRTENDSFAQIVSVGADPTIASGPDVFVVKTNDGQVLTYEPFTGTRATSGVGFNPTPLDEVDSVSSKRVVWLLTKQADRSGNDIRWTYTGDFSSGDYRPDRITYTYNTGILTGSRYVQFTYEDRPDVAVSYEAGVKYTLAKRIKSIDMYAPNPATTGVVWRYNFSYITSSNTKRSLLTSIAQCSPTGACLKAKQFDWNNPAAVPWFTASTVGQAIPQDGTRAPALQVMDLDGDGTDDAIYSMGGSSDATDPVYARLGYRQNNGSVSPLASLYPVAGSLPANTEVAHSRPLDLDGDGKVDYDARWWQSYFWNDSLMKWDNQAKKFVATGTAFTSANDVDFGDVNGDGLVDELATLSMALNTGTGTFGTTYPVPTLCNRQVTDTDGDGRAELTGITMVGKSCLGGMMSYGFDDSGKAHGKEMSFTALNVTFQRTLPSAVKGYWMRAGDFNGDGLVDTLILPTDPSKAATIAWNTGAGLTLDSHAVAIPRDKYGDVRVADVNDDGRSDLVAFGAQSVLLVSMGDGTFVSGVIANDSGTVVNSAGRTTTQLGDFNGDGRMDIVRVVNNQLSLLTQSSIVGIDKIKSVRDEGATLPRETVTYGQAWTDHSEKLTDYTCTYPLLCQRHGMVVVRQVSSQVHNVDKPAAAATTHPLFYSYEDPVADLHGRGFLGFGTFRVWDPQRPTETITTYDQRSLVDGKYYPGAAHPASATTVTPILTQAQVAAKPATATARISRTTSASELRKLNGGKTYAVFPKSSTTKRWEQPVTITWGPLGGPGGSSAQVHLGGVQVPAAPSVQVNQTFDVDDFGNVTHRARATVGGVSTTVDTTYDNRIDDWLIGLPTTSATTVTEADNNPAAVTRHADKTYDDLGRLATQTIEKGNADPSVTSMTTYAYDSLGVVRKVTSSAAGLPNRVTHVEYTPSFPGQPAEEVYPSQTWLEHDLLAYRPSQWTIVHPAYGVVLASEGANGVVSSATYDDLGRPVSAKADGQAPIGYTYLPRPDAAGGTNGSVAVTSSNGRFTSVVTDRLGRVIESTTSGFDGTTSRATATFDVLGRLAAQSRPFTGPTPVAQTTHVYDSLDREVVTNEPGGAQLTSTYSLFTTKGFDAQGHETDTTVDVDGRVTKRVAINVVPAVSVTPITTTYEYGPFDQIDKVIDDKGNVTSFSYDVLGRRTQLDEPDRGSTQTSYFGTGEVHTQTRMGTNETTTYAYDDLGRKVAVINDDGTASYTWDSALHGIGKLASATSADGIRTDFRYDTVGRVVGTDYVDETDNNATYAVDRAYNANGQLASVSYPDEFGKPRLALSYTYNNRGYLSGVGRALPVGGSTPIWAVTARNADLSLHTGVLGAAGQIALDHTVDPITGVLNGVTASEGSSKLLGVTYAYDPNGLMKTRTQSDVSGSRSESYTYDSVGRLVDWKRANGNSPTADTGYSYDTTGNLQGISHGGSLTDERTFGSSRPHELTVRDATLSGGELNSYEYDGQGRLTVTKAEDDTVEREISYTSSDHPRSVTVAGNVTTFAYDAFGQRVKQTGPDGTTFTVPGAFEKRTSGGSSRYVYQVQGSDGPVAQVVIDGAGTHTNYLLTDALGSVSAVVDGSGATFQPLFYDPFGMRINADGTPYSGTTGDVLTGFTGARHDDQLGLINMTGRVYDPSLQRFTSADPYVTEPMSGQSWNPYSYVRNSPTNLVDPSGYIYMGMPCDAASYQPECGGGGGWGGSWGAYSGGGGGGGGGGYNAGVFNPCLKCAEGGWRERQSQWDAAEFFGAAEAYGNGGAHGLAGWEAGRLGREVGELEQEYGRGGFKEQADKLAAAAKSDANGYKAPKVTLTDTPLTPAEEADFARFGRTVTSPAPTTMEESFNQFVEAATGGGGTCGELASLGGTGVVVSLCTVTSGDTSFAWIEYANHGGSAEQIDTITIYDNGKEVGHCKAMSLQSGASGICGAASGLGNAAYSAQAYYWNSRDETLGKAWFSEYSKWHSSPWDQIGDD